MGELEIEQIKSTTQQKLIVKIRNKKLRELWPEWLLHDSKTVIAGDYVNSITKNNCLKTAEYCSFEAFLNSETCNDYINNSNKDSDCTAQVLINNTDGDLIEIVAWDFSPLAKTNIDTDSDTDTDTDTDNLIGPKPKLTLEIKALSVTNDWIASCAPFILVWVDLNPLTA